TSTFRLEPGDGRLAMHAELPESRLALRRELILQGETVRVRETVTNGTAIDRPVGWTQHVTLGPPFLSNGTTEIAIPADRSMVFPGTFGPADYLAAGREFAWPHAPAADGGAVDLRRCSAASASSAYTAHRMDVSKEDAWFAALSPAHELLL